MSDINPGSVIILSAIVYFFGFTTGMWFSERAIRHDKTLLEKDRLFISMPVDAKTASDVLETLRIISDMVRNENTEQNSD